MAKALTLLLMALPLAAQTCRDTNSCAPYVDGGRFSTNYSAPASPTWSDIKQTESPRSNPAYNQQWRDSHYIERQPNEYNGYSQTVRSGVMPQEQIDHTDVALRAARDTANLAGCGGAIVAGVVTKLPAIARFGSSAYCLGSVGTTAKDIRDITAPPRYSPIQQPRSTEQQRTDAARTSISGRENQWRVQDECHPWTVSAKCRPATTVREVRR